MNCSSLDQGANEVLQLGGGKDIIIAEEVEAEAAAGKNMTSKCIIGIQGSNTVDE